MHVNNLTISFGAIYYSRHNDQCIRCCMVPDAAFIVFASVKVTGYVELERGDKIEEAEEEEDETG